MACRHLGSGVPGRAGEGAQEAVGSVLDCGRHVHVGGCQARQEGFVAVSDSRLGNSAMEVPFGERTVDGVLDLRRAEGLAGDSDTVWITAKLGNVLLHPLEHFQLVEDTVVARSLVSSGFVTLLVELRVSKVSKCIITAIEGNENHILQGHTAAIPTRCCQ